MIGTRRQRATHAAAPDQRVDAHVRERIALHFDPIEGAPYWLDRQRALALDVRREVRRFDDLALLGDMTSADLRGRPLLDYVPRALHGTMSNLTVAQTGGTSGPGAWTVYDERDLAAAFVDPFVSAAGALGFPRRAQWLFVGPSGPHVIGKVVRHLASAFGSPEPFAVDFDPRWAKKLPEGSFARQRYLAHVVDQAAAIIESQDVAALFTTPPVLRALAARMSAAQRERIGGVHYGGLPISPAEMSEFQTSVFPKAVHLSGYGNTLFGCCMELSARVGRPMDYFPHGDRLVVEVVDENGTPVPAGAAGRVRFTRLDRSMLIVRMRERDVAEPVPCPAHAAPGFGLAGVRNPHTPPAVVSGANEGIY
jgi:phenylacetate-coenzyme A ligase PaaK-like adenylate-forming protein